MLILYVSRIDLHQEVTGLHVIAGLDRHFRDQAGGLRLHFDHVDRLDYAGRLGVHDDVAALCGCGVDRRVHYFFLARAGEQNERGERQHLTIHGWLLTGAILVLQFAPDEGFELGLRDAIIVTGGNERRARLVQRGLRCEQVEQRRCAEGISLLLHSQILFGGFDRGLLNLDTALGELERTEVLRQVLLGGEARVAKLSLRVVLRYAGAHDGIFARKLVEQREVQR